MAPENASDERSARWWNWIERLEKRDPRLHAQLTTDIEAGHGRSGRSGSGVREEAASSGQTIDLVAETIVRRGRPALLIQDNQIVRKDAVIEASAQELVARLMEAAATLEPLIPLVGRIDVTNYPNGAPYLGTGWLVDKNVVVTNRHVAELLVGHSEGEFSFRMGRFGNPIGVTVDYRRELGINAQSTVRVQRVLWIEPDPRKADIAFLMVDGRSDGTRLDHIPLAGKDATDETDVAVVGYPARAPAHIIPDQAWMDQIYSNSYDVKRIAPGQMGTERRGWATHDCTTLGGNSGSVVLDMKKGQAVALHFAGEYLIDNYAVPASAISKYIRERPWEGSSGATRARSPRREDSPRGDVRSDGSTGAATVSRGTADANGGRGGPSTSVSVTIPLTISVSLGQPTLPEPPRDSSRSNGDRAEDRPIDIESAARELYREVGGNGVLAVRPGFSMVQGGLSDTACLVVAAHPDMFEKVRDRMAPHFRGFPVEARPASIRDQLGLDTLISEAISSVEYNDEDRRGDGFSFEMIDDEMKVTAHVGPERSWHVLENFIDGAQRELVSSIYEFHAEHIADAIQRRLDAGVRMKLVMAAQSRDPKSNRLSSGDFDRSSTFTRWGKQYRKRFERIFVPLGTNGLVATSYHIKVTVRDEEAMWLSSGNWKQSSQPVISDDEFDDPAAIAEAGNREWHVVIENPELAARYRNHILADYEQSKQLGGTPEAVLDLIMIDVPMELLEGIDLERPPSKILNPLVVDRKVRVKPLLTPDRKGAVYSKAVLKLIQSAERQLVFQNQYITMTSPGFIDDLVDALIEKANSIDDVRLILRSDVDGFWDNVSELKRRGLNVSRCMRRLPKSHTKGIVVDGKRVLIGSHNWSAYGVTLNRDASLLFEDKEIAQYFLEAFEIDWDRAGRLNREAIGETTPRKVPRVAEGPFPPSGYVRMPLSDYMEG